VECVHGWSSLHYPEGWVWFDNWRPFVVFLAECAKTDRTDEEMDEIAGAVEASRPVEGEWFRHIVADNYFIEFSLGNECNGRLRFASSDVSVRMNCRK